MSIVLDPGDAIASATPEQWAAQELQATLAAHGIAPVFTSGWSKRRRATFASLAAGADSPAAREIVTAAGVTVSTRPNRWD